ncbi:MULTISPECIES: TetR/AcrR family transcriptional regulator [Gordonia]|uniref:TetR/AcrR family transcriptional regulator n=2 Tax=Gordonia TaxID=2053 RepID=A0ABN3HFM7_9ACTN|nr:MULTISPECIES: TetR/AcrR family transcriptional regulator [Gordonia]AUH68711.1 TetR/AcrR family transcriptional regulator [Gordonia sp. YC-JH1]KJR05608.1 TetR family transcriptional regulator [Gordonia sihwensis]KXT57995.1 TetR family transcriptional regulator [Gordonia sp. QH-12]MBY4571300.1 TetR family transcriptional regulator [Gordonia sihwensis]WFN91431.1 TetR/AcrR family transcriptional regulator [Gordonia sihwensis]
MARISRADQKERNRAALLATARTQFLDAGYAATSLDAIAEAAGFSKGAVYSNFKDKPTLCRAVLEDIHGEKLNELRGIVEQSTDLHGMLDAFAAWVRRTIGDVEWTMLEMEFAVLSRHHPEQKAMIVSLREDARDALAGLLETVLGDFSPLIDQAAADTSNPVPTRDEIADLILSTGIGLGIQRAIDPAVSVEPGIALIRSAFGR